MAGCSKTSAGAGGAVSALPDDPLVDILSRVPARSMSRFKCVSKAWLGLITDPDHRKKLRQAMQGFFVQAADVAEAAGDDALPVAEAAGDDAPPVAEAAGDDAPPAGTSFSFLDLAVRSVPLDIDPAFSFLAEPAGIRNFVFFDSCNGLILFGQPSHHLSDGTYIVCNPTTKEWSAVPACGPPEALSHTYLAFDPKASSHFRLVQFQMPEEDTEIESLHVYSSETGTWSENQIDGEQKKQGELEGWHLQFKLEVLDNHCAFVGGFHHLIVWCPDRQHILVMDAQGKARRIIAVPGMADGSQGDNVTCYLGQSHGHLHCVTIESAGGDNDKLSTWILQDYDTQEWLLKSTVNYLDVFVNSLDVFRDTEVRPEYQVVDIHQDCNVLYFFLQLTRELIAYDMDRKEVSVIATYNEYKFRVILLVTFPISQNHRLFTNKH